ncbi:hypothetical protein [Adlercreutzia sp. ZJ138]|uniref:hypothetical protein n=1 Tax=Adlercreutzia sp. ZJ138 TaxID=2709405 RepID=UPI0013EAEC67|nr:hypothetical protein [Adlercreutzia sp. ZJ138]
MPLLTRLRAWRHTVSTCAHAGGNDNSIHADTRMPAAECSADKTAPQLENVYRKTMLVASVLMLLASFVLLAGASSAWFTDAITIRGNVIKASDTFPTKANSAAQSDVVEGTDTSLENPGTPMVSDGLSNSSKNTSDTSPDTVQPDSNLESEEGIKDSSTSESLSGSEEDNKKHDEVDSALLSRGGDDKAGGV